MTLAELVAGTTWPEIKAALVWLDPEAVADLPGYRQVFRTLRAMTPEPDSMRIAIEARVLPSFDEDPASEVIGRNGTLNRELPDYPRTDLDSEDGRQEAAYSLTLQPWRKWLGMSIEQATLQAYRPAQIIAFVLSDMSFHGFTEAENRLVLEELHRRVDELNAMTDEEREAKLIPAEQVLAELKRKYGMDDPEADA